MHLDLTVGNPGAQGRLRQVTAGFDSRGFSFAYQHDIFDGVTGHTYRLGVSGASQGLAGGIDYSLYRGQTGGSGWDVGALYVPAAARGSVALGVVLQNIGQPVVRGFIQRFTVAPGATVRPVAGVALSVQGRLAPSGGGGFAAGLKWSPGLLSLLARLDTDRSLRRAGFAFGLSVGGQDVVGTVLTTPGDVSGIDAASVYGVSSRVAHH